MRSHQRWFSAALVCVALAGCDDKSDPTDPGTQASIRFANATSNVAGLTFAVRGATAAQNVAFGTPSQCMSFNAGAAVFTAVQAGTTTAFGGTLNQSLTAGARYTVLATGSATSPQLLFLSDAATAPTAGRARLRIVNAIPGTTASDIFVTAPNATLTAPSATNVAYNTATTFLDVAAGQTQIRFRNAGTQTGTFTGTAFNVNAGEITTVVVAPGTTAGTFRTFALQPCP